jgi:hypothetical protein
MVINFRALNKITIKEYYPHPLLEKLIQTSHGWRFSSNLVYNIG